MNVYHIEGFGRYSWCYAIIAAPTESDAEAFYTERFTPEFKPHHVVPVQLQCSGEGSPFLVHYFTGYE